MVHKTIQFFYLLLFFFLSSSVLHASEFHLNATSLGQVRKNSNLQKEIPVNNYLGLTAAKPEWNSSIQTNLRVFRDFDRKIDDTDLYQAVFHYQPLDILKIDTGRQFINKGFTVETLDGLQTTLTPWEYLDVSLYSGVPRSVETGDFNKNDGLLTGISFDAKNIRRTHAGLHAAWRKNDATIIDWKTNDEAFVGGNFSHQFAISMTPMIYSVFEHDLSGKLIRTGTAGVDVYPLKPLALNLEFNYFDVSRTSDRKTIEELFSYGRTLRGRFSSTWTLLPHTLDLVGSYSYQNVEITRNDFRNAHLVDTGLKLTWEDVGLRAESGYYFDKSFGGRLHGVKSTFHEDFTEKLYADLEVDFTKYKKITNNNDSAVSTVIWTGYEILKGLMVSGGFEYNKNTFFNKDTRGSFRVDYHFDQGS